MLVDKIRSLQKIRSLLTPDGYISIEELEQIPAFKLPLANLACDELFLLDYLRQTGELIGFKYP